MLLTIAARLKRDLLELRRYNLCHFQSYSYGALYYVIAFKNCGVPAPLLSMSRRFESSGARNLTQATARLLSRR